jgi:acetyl-CoA synthetase
MSPSSTSRSQSRVTDQQLTETRRFPPPSDFSARANAQPEIYQRAGADRLAFWADEASRLDWERPWDEVLECKPPFAKWFVGGTLNVAVNCVDRHVAAGNGDRIAYHWIGEPEGDERDISDAELKDLVCRAANALTEMGVRKGDRVAIYP